ncbi:MAG TPA: hypothetical protein VGO96_12775 [Pyrinomonadaceae bacterium]|jgi:uncharacterized protein (DUF1810 family)|nr:hypothetical protein [Pyrinomonadaceae bacterium]
MPLARLCLACLCLACLSASQVFPQLAASAHANASPEYLWYEAENMRGFSVDELNNPVSNPSWAMLKRASAPGWGMNGPGVSAEWSQGGESEWNSAAASEDETRAEIYQDVEIPRAGHYKIWVRYADWLGKTETFTLRIMQNGREVFRHEFGARDKLAPHDETGMYWGWAFNWDAAATTNPLAKGAARISFVVERAAETRRHVDCFLLTNDLAYVPEGRSKPDFAARRVLREFSAGKTTLAPLVSAQANSASGVPAAWRRPTVAGRDFMMPWNIAPEFWPLLDKPPAERPLYPFKAEPLEEFIANYKGARDVPLFSSPLVVPVITLDQLTTYVQEGSPFLRYLRETRAPFAVVINYSAATMTEAQGQAAWKLLNGELREQFIGWISGESIGHVWNAGEVAALKLTSAMPRSELLEANRAFYTRALERKWSTLFHTQTGAMWDKLIPAQATSSTTFAHALGRWGTRMIGLETSAVQPTVAMRVAFTRGAARQYGASFLYYHAPNFGDTATTFTRTQNFAGPDHFFHTRYGATMGPSLSWYRKTYYLYYMAGASAIYLEQGNDQFFKPAPGTHPFQLNPLGRITNEFINFAERHKERGTPYTPVAFLLDPAHGWDMTDYPQWAFGVSPQGRHDRALRELFGAAYYPAPVNEGDFATADRQFFTNGIFGDIFDVLVASDERREAIDAYRVVVAGGRVQWTPAWTEQLKAYVRKGGTLVLNAAQLKNLPEDLTGVRPLNSTAEADDARCLLPNEAGTDLRGGVYAYERVERRGAEVLMQTETGDPLVTSFKSGSGRVIFCAIPDLLGLDERLTPTAAHLFAHLFAEATPLRITGDVERLINRTERGWLVTLINNNGVFKPQQGMAQVDRRASVEVTLSLRGKTIGQAREWTLDAPLEVERNATESAVKIIVPPGDLKIVELIEGR